MSEAAATLSGMNFAAYADLWRASAVRQAVVLGALGKAPWFATQMILTLHVVRRLGEPYAAAGVLSAVFTVAVGLASPWRGRLLDRVGLRRTLLPSLVITPPAFVVAPFLPFWALLPLMVVVGLFAVPWFVLTRQVVLAAVGPEQRRTALALDSVVTELAFMIGPALGILGAVYGDTRLTMPLFAALSTLAGVVLWRRNPPLASEDAPALALGAAREPWLTAPVVGLFLLTAASVFVLGGQDLAIVASVRAMGAEPLLAVVMAAWSLGSLLGGLLYGSMPHRNLPAALLVLGLAVTTFPAVLATEPWGLSLLMGITGLFCAPSLSAVVEALSHVVPESRRGEAMGWQGTFSTLGNSISPPLIGWVMDSYGWRPGFLVTGALGVVAVALGAGVLWWGLGRRRGVAASPQTS